MSRAIESEPYQVIWLIRRLFRALAQRSNENLEGFGISVADRAVMEFLCTVQGFKAARSGDSQFAIGKRASCH
jgi:hypothetical protein